MFWAAWTGVVALAAFAIGWLFGRRILGRAAAGSLLTDLESQFVERMRDVSLIGTFTERGEEGKPASPERYDIASVEKVGPDSWRFKATLQCCGINGTLPVVVPMRWVGDTPVIMMTDTNLPGLGTFSVRVCFYGDRYSGIWQHGARGGHMAGQIARRAAAPDAVIAVSERRSTGQASWT
jgi:hypothetical protein